jgi:DNA invertase Pin-like site-specific DNA recombinase
MSKLIGYARTSTVDQAAGFEAQKRDLVAAGASKLYQEQISSVAHRAELVAMLEAIHKGDVVIVTKLDRLARSMRDLCDIVGKIEAKGASLRILNMGLDTTTATGKLMLNVLGSVAEFERAMMLERQREGIAKAKAEGKYKGRKPTTREHGREAKALADAGLKPTQIGKALGISRASVYRLLESA